MGRLNMNNTETFFNTSKNCEKGQWHAEKQIAGPGNENDEAASKLWVQDCPPELARIHERPSYANEGIKQCWYIKCEEATEGGSTTSTNLTHDAELEEDKQYRGILESMQQGMDQEAPPLEKQERQQRLRS